MLDCRCIFFQRFWRKRFDRLGKKYVLLETHQLRFLELFSTMSLTPICNTIYNYILHFEILYFRASDFEGLGNVVVEFRVFDGKFVATATVLYVVSDNSKFDFCSIFFSIVLIDFNVAPIITFRPDILDYTEGHPSSFLNSRVTITDVNDLNMTG